MKITENFEYIGTQQNFERDSYTTLAEMKAVVDKRMPDIFTATCKETGKFYIYNKNNEVNETLGKWREVGIDGDNYVTKIYVDTEIAKKADITSIPSKVSELTNDSNYQTAEQISSTVTTEIAKVVANAPENFDTLKEMSDWIAGHENDASAMNSVISDNKAAITALQSGKADKSEIPTTISELTDSADYAKKTDIPTTLPANGGNADTVNNHTVESNVPADAKFTDTVYDDTEVKAELAKKADITSIPSKVSELTNDSNYQTAEQVNDTVTTEIAKVVANAPEDLNTLKEMSDWIAGHEEDASAMNSAISDNKTVITSLQNSKADKSEIPTTVAELTDSADYAKKSDLHSHTNKTVLDGITSTKVSNWDSAKTHADSAHAPSTAQANVIETVKVNGAALEVSDKAVNVTVPTKVSELTNDSRYIIIDDTKSSDTTTYSSSKIVSEITNEATTRQKADTALQSALALRKSYDFVVDSNETLLAWANCTDGSMKSVLVKSGEYTLNGKTINLVNAGTKFVFAENGNKIISNYQYGISATKDYDAVIIGLNVELSYIINTEGCYAFYRGMICYNCTGKGRGDGDGTGFYGCTCSSCTGTGTTTSSNKGYGFYNCTCNNCTGSGGSGRGGSCYGFYNCTCSNCTGSGYGGYSYGYGFYNCACSNCTGSGGGAASGGGYGFYSCTCSNCTGSGSASYGSGYGFYSCSYCSSCRAGKTASTTATWGGTNTYIDSDSCDYVAS